MGSNIIGGEGYFDEEDLAAIAAAEDDLEQALLLTSDAFPLLVDVREEKELENIRAICLEAASEIIEKGKRALEYKAR